MIKKIIHTADIHIKNLRRQDEYQEQLSKFLNECRDIVKEYGEDQVRIVVSGDLVHNKLEISGEAYILTAWFLRSLDEIAKTIVIAGNHDLNVTNLSRLDPLSAIFSMCKFKQVHYLDYELQYQSGCVVDDNVVWCLYSIFDNFTKPNIDEMKLEYPDLTYVGLFHGAVIGCKTDLGYKFETGLNSSFFEGINFGLFGHIHKRQTLTNNGVKLVYPGSLIQQDHGENVSSHGYLLWDVEEETFETHDIENPNNGFYTFTIESEDDLDEDKEEIINL